VELIWICCLVCISQGEAMIHVFRACGSACSVCFSSCDVLMHGCGNVCGGLIRCFEAVLESMCNGCGEACQRVIAPLRKPLGGYILLSLILCLSVFASAIYSLHSDKLGSCYHMTTANGVNAALGVIHIVFALYVQHRLTVGLRSEDGTTANNESGGASNLTSRAWHIVLYDLGFCFYLLVFCFSLVWSIFGIAWSLPCRFNSTGIGLASILLLLHNILAVAYMFCWCCVVSCCGLSDIVIHRLHVTPSQRTPWSPNQSAPLANPCLVAEPVLDDAPTAMGV